MISASDSEPLRNAMKTKTATIQSLKELKAKMKPFAKFPEDQRKSMVCALVGHSRIQTVCFGYYNCARCGEQVGDTLASIYPGAEKAVIVGHKCDRCVENYEACTWQDTYLAPDPFSPEPVENA